MVKRGNPIFSSKISAVKNQNSTGGDLNNVKMLP
jgi:hypothetical protein